MPALADKALDGRAPVRRHRAGRAACAAHALAHVHARRRLAGVDRHEHGVRGRCAKANATAEAAPRDGLHGLCVSADGAGRAVETLLEGIPEHRREFDPNAVPGAAARRSAGCIRAGAPFPARWALEHRDWKAAAALRPPAQQPVAVHRCDDAISRARSARRAQPSGRRARRHRRRSRLGERLAQAKEAYWAEQVGDSARRRERVARLGRRQTRRCRDGDAGGRRPRGRHGQERITPGPIAPARELLGEMLLELKQPAAALKEFQATLKKEPNRFRAVYGAALSAELSGDRRPPARITRNSSRCARAPISRNGRSSTPRSRSWPGRGRSCSRPAAVLLLILATGAGWQTAAPPVPFKVIGYYADWTASRYPLAQIPADRLTHVNYASGRSAATIG